jgi:hypothetical protein
MEAFTVEHNTSESQYERISTPNTQSTSPRIHPSVIIVCDRSIGTNIRSSPSNHGNHPHLATPTRVKVNLGRPRTIPPLWNGCGCARKLARFRCVFGKLAYLLFLHPGLIYLFGMTRR